MKARLSRALLILALLVAQQAALAHQLWHAGFGVRQVTATVADSERSGSSTQESLCDLHSALGTVLGALSGSTTAPAAVVVPETGFAARQAPVASLSAPLPSSRDPPRLA